MDKMQLGILCGGRSAEHEISLISAQNLLRYINPQRYDTHLIGITKEGKWLYRPDNALNEKPADASMPQLRSDADEVVLAPGGQLLGKAQPLSITLDVVFPILHGPMGEDGAIQGYLKVVDLPFVGPDVLGAAVGMDKDVMKRLLREAGLPIGAYRTLYAEEEIPSWDEIVEQLGSPVFVKPANLGSSVGISKVYDASQWTPAVQMAFDYDRKVVVEALIEGFEVECAVLGNAHPRATIAGELTVEADYYDFETKYLNKSRTKLHIPARVDDATMERIRQLALKAYRALECEGMGRVDIFVTPENELYINEINTIPGFTDMSMCTMLWRYEGIPTDQLIDELIRLAIERHRRQKQYLLQVRS